MLSVPDRARLHDLAQRHIDPHPRTHVRPAKPHVHGDLARVMSLYDRERVRIRVPVPAPVEGFFLDKIRQLRGGARAVIIFRAALHRAG